MASGLALPIYPVNGRLPIETAAEQLQKIVMLQLSDCENINPFNTDVGLDGGIVFQINDATTQAQVRARVNQVFRLMERQGRAKLASGFPTFTVDSDREEMTCFIRYINLETEAEEDMSFPVGTLFGVPVGAIKGYAGGGKP